MTVEWSFRPRHLTGRSAVVWYPQPLETSIYHEFVEAVIFIHGRHKKEVAWSIVHRISE